jgi:hypothetical protein
MKRVLALLGLLLVGAGIRAAVALARAGAGR